jgi:hypothetical protein
MPCGRGQALFAPRKLRAGRGKREVNGFDANEHQTV